MSGGGMSYKFFKADRVVPVCVNSLANHGITLIPNFAPANIQPYETVNSSGKTVINYAVTVHGTMNLMFKGEVISIGGCIGMGIDNSDKAIGKAVTNAIKFWLLRTFGISEEGEKDPDEERKQIAQDGKEILERKFKQHNIRFNSENLLFLEKYFNMPSMTELYFRIAKGKIDTSKLRDIDNVNGLLQLEKKTAPKEKNENEI
jgi:hypothetical protein